MEILNKFIEAFKAKVILKTNQGTKARMQELDEVAANITASHGAIPDIAKIRAYFFKCLSGKTNWGCRHVIREFDRAISKFDSGV